MTTKEPKKGMTDGERLALREAASERLLYYHSRYDKYADCSQIAQRELNKHVPVLERLLGAIHDEKTPNTTIKDMLENMEQKALKEYLEKKMAVLLRA